MCQTPLSSTCLWHVDRGPTWLGHRAWPLNGRSLAELVGSVRATSRCSFVVEQAASCLRCLSMLDLGRAGRVVSACPLNALPARIGWLARSRWFSSCCAFSFAGVVGGDGLGQRRNSVLLRDDGCRDAEGARGVTGHGADAGDGDAGEQPGQLGWAEEIREVAHGGGAREGD